MCLKYGIGKQIRKVANKSEKRQLNSENGNEIKKVATKSEKRQRNQKNSKNGRSTPTQIAYIMGFIIIPWLAEFFTAGFAINSAGFMKIPAAI